MGIGGHHMLKKQVHALAIIMKDKDIQGYTGGAFWSLIKAFVLGDAGAIIDAGDDIKSIIFHTPTLLFWDKMERYLYGTFKNYSEQVKLASKFGSDNEKYEEFVKRQIHLINEIDDDKKIDYFASLTRCFLLTDLEDNLFFKLTKFLNMCTPAELEFLQTVSLEYTSNNNALISSLYQYGLFSQEEVEDGEIKYVLSDFAKALKLNCLNFDEDLRGRERLLCYDQLAPLNLLEPATWGDIDGLFDEGQER